MCFADLPAQLHLVVELLLGQAAEVVVLLQRLVQHLPLMFPLLRQLLQHLCLLGLPRQGVGRGVRQPKRLCWPSTPQRGFLTIFSAQNPSATPLYPIALLLGRCFDTFFPAMGQCLLGLGLWVGRRCNAEPTGSAKPR